VGPA